MSTKHLEAQGPQNFASAGKVGDIPKLDDGNHAGRTQFSRLARLRGARSKTDGLFTAIDERALYERPIPERHRLIFYLGHFDAFDWNQLCRGALQMPAFHPAFDRLFEAGIDPEPGKGPQDQPHDWPRVDEVRAYVAKVRELVDSTVANAPPDIFGTILEHRLMHAETFAYLMHELAYDHKRGAGDQPLRCAPPEHGFVDIPSGAALLGQERGSFGWDNEFERHKVEVDGFELGRHKVTNGEYLDFVREGARAPHFWLLQDGQWFWRGMFEASPLDPHGPVYVTYDEAFAYAEWKGAKLMTEAQFHRAAYGSGMPAGSTNVAFSRWDPIPVTADEGLQLIGNGWEWTSTPFAPFPGFQASAHYPGYSQPFFDGEHFVLKGASPRTAPEFLRPSFRNWFRHEYPYVYGTFRLVRS